MNYYDELIDKIDCLISDEKYNEAKQIINDELSIPYIPKDIEEKLNNYLFSLTDRTYEYKNISDDELISYLKADNEHQLIAVDQLSKKNLRNYIEICEDYLSSNGFLNSKALLIDSLIEQEINYNFKFNDNKKQILFNPSKLIRITELNSFKLIHKKLEDIFLKEPSMLKLSEQLLYKEFILHLPNQYDENMVDSLTDKICTYLYNAFDVAK